MAPAYSPPEGRQHGVKGVYYAGDWLDIEDCDGVFSSPPNCSGCPQNTAKDPCPRSKSRNATEKDEYDIVIVGAGCIGSAIARELSKYCLSILWVEAADDVSQGATKGNSGIVHAGYDDKPGTNRAKFCWPGNQMFSQLDKELRFGYQKNGSLVLATSEKEMDVLADLKKRGDTNGVKRLEIWDKQKLFEMEPHLNPNCVGALHAPDAGNVIPYEFAIALAENAVDNGVELRVRREVSAIERDSKTGMFEVSMQHWEPSDYLDAAGGMQVNLTVLVIGLVTSITALMGSYMAADDSLNSDTRKYSAMATWTCVVAGAMLVYKGLFSGKGGSSSSRSTPFTKLVEKAGLPTGTGGTKVAVEDMFTGGSGSRKVVKGKVVEIEKVKAKYVINCAGGASDKIAAMIGDDFFKIKPRLGDYLLLNRNQGHLAKRTLFPCPDPVLGKGVLVQTTLWGNLILGPTARDTYKPEARDMTAKDIQEYILSKCKQLVPSFDPKETIHAFCGARAKNSTGDWIIQPSSKQGNFIHVAGIDSPGLAGAPAIALEVVKLLQKAGLATPPNSHFNPNRAPIITPKAGMRGLKMGPVGKNDSDGTDEAKMAANVICKCEKVTELEVVRALRRSLPIDSTQAIRKRTRAGMGHCQGDAENYNCEARVKAIIARENGVAVNHVGGRPWPATSTLTQRWIDDNEKKELQNRMDVQ